jgi:hypothetical protein
MEKRNKNYIENPAQKKKILLYLGLGLRRCGFFSPQLSMPVCCCLEMQEETR